MILVRAADHAAADASSDAASTASASATTNGSAETVVIGSTQPVFPGSAVLLYDGDCGFCAGSVQFVLAHERASRRSALRFAPLQGVYGAWLRARFPVLDTIDSVVWFDPMFGRVLTKSDAALETVAHLGGLWRVVAFTGRLVPRVVRDAAYDAIARRRLQLAAPACLLPSADTRARFLP
jgi:predicted DCC family thiol-disulfide oxidoreductase YuxK